jgi:hypothetical protein
VDVIQVGYIWINTEKKNLVEVHVCTSTEPAQWEYAGTVDFSFLEKLKRMYRHEI